MLKGQAKTDYQREYMRRKRSKEPVRPNENVRPVLDPVVRPNVKTYDPKLDPLVNPLLRPPEAHLPNCPDGRYRPYSKEEQLGIKMTKKTIAFDELKTKYDIRLT